MLRKAQVEIFSFSEIIFKYCLSFHNRMKLFEIKNLLEPNIDVQNC
jgi:hypothetical protein